MVTRKRLTPEESRHAALVAAREILLEGGPQQVTLKSVASRIDRTHANLLHHFGTAADLQRELAAYIADGVCEAIGKAVHSRRLGQATPRDLINLTFDAFDQEGAGALASWMLLNGNEDALDPILDSIDGLIERIVPEEVGRKDGNKAVHELTFSIVLLALGDALMGKILCESMDVPRETGRATAEKLLTELIAQRDAAGLGKP